MPKWWRRKRAAHERDAADHAATEAAPEAKPPNDLSGSPDATPGPDAPLSSVADKVQEVLTAAEQTAAAIRREASADAARVADERRRQRQAAAELDHLSGLADAMAVQAESVKRQCAVLYGLLAPDARESPAESSEARSDPPSPASPHDASPPPGDASASRQTPESPGDESPSPPELPADEDAGPPRPRNGEAGDPAAQHRVKAYRMRLAGAERREIESFLDRTGVDEPARMAAEIFGQPPDQPPKS